MEALLTSVLNWVTDNWGAILGLFGGGAAVSLALETLLRKFKVDSKKLAFSLLQVLALVTSVATYLLANLPTTDVPAIFASLALLAQAWHRFVFSPFYNRVLIPFLKYQAATKPVVEVQHTEELV